MQTPRTSRLALLSVLGALGVAASLAPVASAATQRYASPTGAGTACTSASPCSITQAITAASADDELIVNPGDYPLTATLKDPAQITIHGVAGQPRPRLLFNTPAFDMPGLVLTHSSLLRYIELDQAGTNSNAALLAGGAKLDQVIAKSASGLTAEIGSGIVRGSVFVNSAPNGVALITSLSGDYTTTAVTYRNVTAIATASGGVAIMAYAGYDMGPSTVNVEATNVIARGGPGGADLKAVAQGAGPEATITATNSNYAVPSLSGPGAAITSAGVNQAAAPHFVNPAAGDYHQAAGSPTIDAGLDQPINGAFDVDGDHRQIGVTDIGADEFLFAPTVTTEPASAVTGTSATLNGSVNARRAATSYHFEYGTTTAYDNTTPATSANSDTYTVPVAALLAGLSPATPYHYRIVGTSAGGTTNGADQTFTTTSPATTSPATTQTSAGSTMATIAPPSVFAGVKLVSTRLSFARGLITVTLRCPGGTVGRCSGTTKLTVRRPATSTRAGSTVALGRASFSIASGKQSNVSVRVSRAGRLLLGGVRRVKGKDTNAARNGAGQPKTTVAAVAIRRRKA